MNAVLITSEGGEFYKDLTHKLGTIRHDVFVPPGITCTRIFHFEKEEKDKQGRPVLIYREDKTSYIY